MAAVRSKKGEPVVIVTTFNNLRNLDYVSQFMIVLENINPKPDILSLQQKQINDTSACMLAPSFAKQKLKELDVSGNKIGEKGLSALAEHLLTDSQRQLTKINISNNAITFTAAEAFLKKAMSLQQHINIDLCDNRITPSDIEKLVRLVNPPKIVTILTSKQEVVEKVPPSVATNSIPSTPPVVVSMKPGVVATLREGAKKTLPPIVPRSAAAVDPVPALSVSPLAPSEPETKLVSAAEVQESKETTGTVKKMLKNTIESDANKSSEEKEQPAGIIENWYRQETRFSTGKLKTSPTFPTFEILLFPKVEVKEPETPKTPVNVNEKTALLINEVKNVSEEDDFLKEFELVDKTDVSDADVGFVAIANRAR